MGFVSAVKRCVLKIVDFKGRASRSEFWWFFLFCILVSLPLSLVNGIISGLISGLVTGFPLQFLNAVFGVAVFLAKIAVMIAVMIAVIIRRLHDINRSGWWFFLLVTSPIISVMILYSAIIFVIISTIFFTSAIAATSYPAIVMPILLMLTVLVLPIFLMLKGTNGDNRFGPDPLQDTSRGNTVSKIQPVTGSAPEPKGVAALREAAEQGDADAQYNLGLCYGNGDVVAKDGSKAVYWWQKAARQGSAEAQDALRRRGRNWS